MKKKKKKEDGARFQNGELQEHRRLEWLVVFFGSSEGDNDKT
jgi:hypothetical protein